MVGSATAWSALISVSTVLTAEEMSSEEMNWELTSPLMCVRVPVFGPRTSSGASPLPRVERHSAPSSPRASMSGCMGRLRMDSSPVRTVMHGRREAMPAMILMVVPELSTFMTSSGQRNRPPLMCSTSPSLSASAPNFLTAESVARVSPLSRGRRRCEVPSANRARAMARWV